MPAWKLTVSVDPDLCIGAASCIATAPHLFQLDEDNIAYLKPTGERTYTLTATDEEKAILNEAAMNCPTGAITVKA